MVAADAAPPAFRLHAAKPVVSFGKQDALAPGFKEAVTLAREAGFAPVLRLAGAITAELRERYEVTEASLDSETLALATELEPKHAINL